MTRDEIIMMAQESTGAHVSDFFNMSVGELKTFAALVSAAEREACIALYNHEDVQAPVGNSAWGEARQDGWIEGTSAYREAIRARGEKGQS